MSVAIILVALCASLFGVFYMFFTTRNRERMSMIEKGINVKESSRPRERPESRQRPRQNNSKFLLKVGMFFAGIGVGFVISVFFENLIATVVYPLFVVGVVFFTGGLGMVSGFLIGKSIDKT